MSPAKEGPSCAFSSQPLCPTLFIPCLAGPQAPVTAPSLLWPRRPRTRTRRDCSLAGHLRSLTTFLLCHAQSMKPQPRVKFGHLPAPSLLCHVAEHGPPTAPGSSSRPLQESATLPSWPTAIPRRLLSPRFSHPPHQLSHHLAADTSFPGSQRAGELSEENAGGPVSGPLPWALASALSRVSPGLSRIRVLPQSWLLPTPQECCCCFAHLERSCSGSHRPSSSSAAVLQQASLCPSACFFEPNPSRSFADDLCVVKSPSQLPLLLFPSLSASVPPVSV